MISESIVNKRPLPVKNFRRYLPICSMGFMFMILVFAGLEEINYLSITLFVILMVSWGLYFLYLYRKQKVLLARITNYGIEVHGINKKYQINFNRIVAIDKVLNYDYIFRYRYSSSYVIEFDRDYLFGNRLFLVYDFHLDDPDDIVQIKQEWMKCIP